MDKHKNANVLYELLVSTYGEPVTSVSLGWATSYKIKQPADLLDIPVEPLGLILRGGKRWQHPP